ncbi:MAG: S49 family peptidase [Pseudomonadota bacterium]
MADLSEQIVSNLLAEQRKSRRWKNFRFFIWVIILLLIISLIYRSSSETSETSGKGGPYGALVKMNGIVADGQSFSAENIVPLLTVAFENKSNKVVVLDINSPGGSPAQAQIIYDQIMALKRQYHKPVIAVGQDMMTSAAYLVASAADKIYVTPETITGSIGVLMQGFGFTHAMEKLGIERRLFTAGKNKVLEDPFSPLKQSSVDRIHTILQTTHQVFIDDVEKGRGKRLKTSDSELFSGSFWLGQKAVALGLADGIGNIYSIKPSLGIKNYQYYQPQEPLLKRLVGQTATAAIEKIRLLAYDHLQF